MTNEIKSGVSAESALGKLDDMDRLVPSAYMREIFREEGFEFTDSQKATMIWNAPGRNRDWKLTALRELVPKGRRRGNLAH